MGLGGETAMIGLCLAFSVLVGQTTEADPTELVKQLGSPRYAQREAAAETLESLGRTALPALRTAKDLDDLEVRARASGLITKIESSLMTSATMVQLDFQDRPLEDVLNGISSQTGLKLVIMPDQNPILKKRITLRSPEPVRFWEMLDQLSEVAGVYYQPNINMNARVGGSKQSGIVVPLYLGAGRTMGVPHDNGPFRIYLTSIHHGEDVLFTSARQSRIVNGNPIRPILTQPQTLKGVAADEKLNYQFSESFNAQLQLTVEPRLSIAQRGALKLEEAVDDLGQSLRPKEDPQSPVQRYSGYFGYSEGSNVHIQVPMVHPDNPGKLIRRLKGTIPVLVSTRKGDALKVPLDEASRGKSFQTDDVTIEVHEYKATPNTNQATLQLSIQTNQDGDDELDVFDETPIRMAQRGLIPQNQLEIVDAEGNTIQWMNSPNGDTTRQTLLLITRNQQTPVELRYYPLVRAATEVHFEFDNLPLR